MNKLFRQVKSSERLPKKNDTYATSRGDCLYHVNLDGFLNDMGFRIMPEYWYEPVKIPTDEEIEKDGKEGGLEGWELQMYWEGYKTAIKHLTGGKEQ